MVIFFIWVKEKILGFFFFLGGGGERTGLRGKMALRDDADQYQYLGYCPPTPPLTQQQSIENKLKLMLG